MEKTPVIAVLGATGSVGTQALDVARAGQYRVDFISGGKNVEGICRFAREFSPRLVAMADERAAEEVRRSLRDTDVTILAGQGGILEGIRRTDAEVTVNSILGEAGLLPTLEVLKTKQRLALANKESLVIAGDLVMAAAAEAGKEILPVDSEHCAIFQSLLAGKKSEIRRLWLTASGGPFYGYTKEQLRLVNKAQTLNHPTWKMGQKITVDSATLMNKGFEIMEAAHLFGVPSEHITVVVHRESILHSAVEYIDNTVIGEMSVPDMRMCVQYAVDYPHRRAGVSMPLDFFSVGKMTFSRPDEETFPLLTLAKRASTLGGGMGAVLNAADEVAVAAFLAERIPFWRISEVVAETFESCLSETKALSLTDRLEADRHAREEAARLVARMSD